MGEIPFWRRKSLAEMSDEEWESLCDGCGRCCLVKLQDEDDGTIAYTDVACWLLDGATCRCRNYEERKRWVPDCVVLTPETVSELRWLPSTCAYRLLAEGEDLLWWHPLVCGNPDMVHQVGASVRHRVVSETQVAEEDLVDNIIGECIEIGEPSETAEGEAAPTESIHPPS